MAGDDTGGMSPVKATWTSLDLPAMSWRGCKIHGIHIGRYEDDSTGEGVLDGNYYDDTMAWHFLLLDIDYLIESQVAPATLAFTDAAGVTVTIGDAPPLGLGTVETSLVIDDLQRIEPTVRTDPHWHITGEGFDIQLRDSGFDLYLRQPPRPSLSAEERGGVSFAQRPFSGGRSQ